MPKPRTAERQIVTCPVCKKSFVERTSRRRKYCGRKCAGVVTASKYEAERKTAKCQFCGKSFRHKPGIQPRFCGIICSNTAKARAHAKTHAEQLRGVPTGKGNSYVKENGRHQHRLVMERHLGRSLRPDEVVHHIDGNIKNNELSNLKIVSRAEHFNLHLGR